MLRQFAWTAIVCFAATVSPAMAGAGNPPQPAPPSAAPASDKVPSTKDLAPFRRTVETLRGKTFRREVPAFTISEQALRAIVRREVEKEYPGGKLADYQALMTWLDMLAPGTDLKAAAEEFCVDQVAGLYDPDTKEMCIPSFPATRTNAWRNPARKEVERFSDFNDGLVFDHELTHALEDQYWRLDLPDEEERHESTDRGMARSFLSEGSATRVMIEAVPAQVEADSPGAYIPLWHVIHSGMVELVLDTALKHVWKSSDVLVPGVPEALARAEAMPYAYGYSFCSGLIRDWGLDGLDYVWDHPPASTEQVMHPQKAWEWRDFPVQITLPEKLPQHWKQLVGDSIGEAGAALFFGCSFKSLNRGELLACGWDGDRVALYEAPNGRRLLVWASSWDSAAAARRFASAWVKQRRKLHKASVTHERGNHIMWSQPDGRTGALEQDGRQVVLYETDQPEGLAGSAEWSKAIVFTQPPEDAARAAANHTLLRINPIFSWRKDGDYTVSKTLWGMLSRHDRNDVGAADRLLLGLAVESHRTASFHKWELGWSLVAKHQSDSRRDTSQTALLPWGVLYGQFSARLPQEPSRRLSRVSSVWGGAFSRTKDGSGRVVFRLLPAGLLFRSEAGPTRRAVHVLGTGVARTRPTPTGGSTARYRLLGIPLWSTHTAPSTGSVSLPERPGQTGG